MKSSPLFSVALPPRPSSRTVVVCVVVGIIGIIAVSAAPSRVPVIVTVVVVVCLVVVVGVAIPIIPLIPTRTISIVIAISSLPRCIISIPRILYASFAMSVPASPPISSVSPRVRVPITVTIPTHIVIPLFATYCFTSHSSTHPRVVLELEDKVELRGP